MLSTLYLYIPNAVIPWLVAGLISLFIFFFFFLPNLCHFILFLDEPPSISRRVLLVRSIFFFSIGFPDERVLGPCIHRKNSTPHNVRLFFIQFPNRQFALPPLFLAFPSGPDFSFLPNRQGHSFAVSTTTFPVFVLLFWFWLEYIDIYIKLSTLPAHLFLLLSPSASAIAT